MVKDFGKFLYRHVHSLHHKSYNPTAFSGTSMHPVEAFLYYTAAAIPCLWGGHPVLAVTAIIDLGIAAWLRKAFKLNNSLKIIEWPSVYQFRKLIKVMMVSNGLVMGAISTCFIIRSVLGLKSQNTQYLKIILSFWRVF